MRETKKSVTCFLKCGEKFLFIHRTKKGNDVDGNRLNGIGGKLEAGENFLDAAIRETKEETGYIVQKENCSLSGVVSLTGGYAQDWIMCFFVIEVPTDTVPIGFENAEGNLLWIHKDEVLQSPYELVDDLNYLWEKISIGSTTFFAASIVNEKEKIETISISEIAK